MTNTQPTIKTRSYPQDVADNLAGAGIDPVLARLFAARGITSADDVNSDIAGLIPPSQMLNVDKAAAILAETIITDRKIVISCDFDVDGCSAGSIALRALRMMGAKHLDFAMPNRRTHGYGLSPLLVQDIASKFAPDLLVTVDCGISSHEGVAEANRLGMKVLVTDHHLCAAGAPLPDAACIVNPNQPGCAFPSKHISGAGVIFYVMLALRAELRKLDYFNINSIPDPNLGSLLDIVALATIADVVRLDKNNRTLVQQGLQRIRAGRACAGINALLQVAGKDYRKASVFDMGFIVGPRLNAAGRLEDASLGVQCLTTDDPNEALAIATRLDKINNERREIEAEMKESALIALEGLNVADRFSLVMFDSSFHQGVIGILASRLKDSHGRPTIVFARGDDGKLKGSGRSIPGLHLRDAIDLVAKRHPGMLPSYGGHAMAAGLTCMEDRFGEFVDAFDTVVRALLDESDLLQVIETDGSIPNELITIEVAEKIEDHIWGQGFPAPTFDDEFVVLEQQILKEKHLKLKLAKDGATFAGIWFFHNELLPSSARLVYSLSVNEFRGAKSVQLMVRHAEIT